MAFNTTIMSSRKRKTKNLYNSRLTDRTETSYGRLHNTNSSKNLQDIREMLTTKAKHLLKIMLYPADKVEDIPPWFAKIIVTINCLSVILTIAVTNPSFLISPFGYADGGDMYSHIAEAIHLKDLIRNNTWNFWYDKVTLGYPVFLAYHPLSTITTALLMLVFESLTSPLLVFRWILVAALSLCPLSWYIGGLKFGLSQLQSVMLSSIVFSVTSWRKFGIETSCFREYGLYTQVYGILLLPLSVSCVYQCLSNRYASNSKINLPRVILPLIFLSHFFFGIYTGILSGMVLIAEFIVHRSVRTFQDKFQMTFRIYLETLLMISFWVIPCAIAFRYVGGLPWRTQSEDGYYLSFLIAKLINGEIFDYERNVSWLTILVVIGLGICITKVLISYQTDQPCIDILFYVWIILSTFTTIILFLGRTTFGRIYNIIPLHSELEVVRYLSGVHFCGLILAALAISHLIQSLYSLIENHLDVDVIKTVPLMIMVSIISAMLLFNQMQIIMKSVTMTTMEDGFMQAFDLLKHEKEPGRVLTNKGMGTGGPWDLAFIPLLTEKPGLLSYSRGYHDSLSLYYLEMVEFDTNDPQLFLSLLHLYNIHYLISSTTTVNLYDSFKEICQLQKIITVGHLEIYHVFHHSPTYGYFDFVKSAGYINGNHRSMRHGVLEALKFYRYNVVLHINPSINNIIQDSKNIKLDVGGDIIIPDGTELNTTTEDDAHDIALFAMLTWYHGEKEINFDEAFDFVSDKYAHDWCQSEVVMETVDATKYQAIVQVYQTKGKQMHDSEYLLLKITYHPFWKCYYRNIDKTFTIDDYKDDDYNLERFYIHPEHVTPNLMAVRLPSGRYHIVFEYIYPGWLKILACLCLLVYIYCLETFLGTLPPSISSFSEEEASTSDHDST